jgi:hypothetical protein
MQRERAGNVPDERATTLRGRATDRGRGERNIASTASGVAIPMQLRRPLPPTAGTPQDCRTDQNTDAQRDTYGDQRSVFGLAGDPL